MFVMSGRNRELSLITNKGLESRMCVWGRERREEGEETITQ